MLENTFNDVLNIIQYDSRVDKTIYNHFVTKLKPIHQGDSFVVLGCRDSYSTNVIKDKKNGIIPALEDAFSLILDKKIRVDIVEENDKESLDSIIIAQRKVEKNQNSTAVDYSTGLQAEYTFENFIEGDCNKFARAASFQVAENPGQSRYNPLFLWGNSGLGKTHLMQAIGNKVNEIHPGKRVLYTTCENFTNEFVKCISSKKYTEFREMFRNVDVLMIDDIQFLISKEGVQSEFFNTFEALISNGKQIVITSDKAPSNLISLDERLTSRFQNGFTMDVQPPDFETRKRILLSMLKDEPIKVSDELINYVCENATKNIREINGAFKIITSFGALFSGEIGMDFVDRYMRNFFSPNKAEQVTPETIISSVALYYGIDVAKIQSKSRSRDILNPRYVAMYIMKEMIETITLEGIGLYFGGKDHSSVINGLKNVEKNEKLLTDAKRIMEKITN